MSEKFIPGTNPEWGRKLPDGMDNSLVDESGNPYDNGYNFDEFEEKDEEEDKNKENENPVATPPNPNEEENKEGK